jgi:hypothetical protein
VVAGFLVVWGSRSPSETHKIWQETSARVIGPSQRPLNDNTKEIQETDIHAPRGFRTHGARKLQVADPPLRKQATGIGEDELMIIKIIIK